MNKKATSKQINYLNYILNCENLTLKNFTYKSINELTHGDINIIFKKLNINNITPCFNNKKYIIEKETDDFIIGKQLILKNQETIIYNLITFKNLLVLDWDISSHSNTNTKNKLLIKIKNQLENKPYTFLIYETYNGYHAYCISNKFNYNDYNTLKFMKSVNCDEYYISYIRKTGFVVRLNKKKDRNEEFIEKYICKINNYKIDKNLELLINIKDNLIENN